MVAAEDESVERAADATGEKVERDEAIPFQAALDGGSEDDEGPHVEEQVEDVGVEEEGGEETQRGEVRGAHAPGADDVGIAHEEGFRGDDEGEDIRDDQEDRRERKALGRVLTSERKGHGAFNVSQLCADVC